jgi:hypothetical protein
MPVTGTVSEGESRPCTDEGSMRTAVPPTGQDEPHEPPMAGRILE